MKPNPKVAQIASDFLVEEEAVALHAYPDPASPLGKELTRRFGAKGIMRIAGGGLIPADLEHLDGSPWTIGVGATGPDIVKGLKWTMGQVKDRLQRDLNKYYDMACRAWPGVDKLHELAQVAMLSLAYNRGISLLRDPKDLVDRRLEMRELVPAVAHKDYLQMAALFRAMCRLWENKDLGGLIARRRREAQLCMDAHYQTSR